jgi:5-methylcytosine-specific restriction endonuclease McrA
MASRKMQLRPRLSIVRNRKLREQVWERDQGVCCDCGRFHSKWEAEHTVPLWSGGKDDLSNVVTRCPPCHKPKTAREAKDRAKSDRVREKYEALKRRMRVG